MSPEPQASEVRTAIQALRARTLCEPCKNLFLTLVLLNSEIQAVWLVYNNDCKQYYRL